MNLIAFTGPIGCGKTEAAKAIEKDGPRYALTVNPPINVRWHRFSFADPIRQMLMVIGLTAEDFTQERKNLPHPLLYGGTPRHAMQTLGTEWGRREIGKNLWADAVSRRIEAAFADYQKVVFDDCRFDNEAVMIRNLGGIVVEIVRPGVGRSEHESERGVSTHLVDRFIRNDGDMAALRAKVLALI